MTLELFPDLPGLEYPVVRTPIFKTLTQESASGMEARAALQLYPRWRWTLSFEFLRDYNSDEFRTLMGFFLARRGAFEAFNFNDPDDNSVTDQPIGMGNGSNKVFQLVRSFGGFTEPVLQPVFTTIKKNGTTTTAWSFTGPGQVTFTTAPGSGVIVTANITYLWPVRFVSDENDFSKFMNRFWEQKQLEFISVKNF